MYSRPTNRVDGYDSRGLGQASADVGSTGGEVEVEGVVQGW